MAETSEAILDGTQLRRGGSYFDDLLPALQQLDHLLERVVVAAQAAYGPEAATGRF